MLTLLGASLTAMAQDAGVTNLWSYYLGARYTQASPALAPDGTVYEGSVQGWLFALAPDGKLRWKFKTGRQIKSSPAVAADGTIYFGSRDRKFYALAPDGKFKWQFMTGAWVDSSPAIAADGTICFGSWDKTFYALKPDGNLKWKFVSGGIVDSSPGIAPDGTIYFGSHDKILYALAPDGKLKWKFTTSGEITSSPALGGDGAVYFTSTDGNFYALNADGTLRWRQHTGGGTAASPVLDEVGNLYLGVNQEFYSFTSAGLPRWHYYNSNPVETSALALADKTIFNAAPFSNSGVLTIDGRFVWVFPVGHGFYSAANLNPDGTLCIADERSVCAALPWRKAGNGWQAMPMKPAKSSWPMWRANPQHTGRVAN
jgi:outer membrane protein assembly factor BamB